jgi:hypothetical protein
LSDTTAQIQSEPYPRSFLVLVGLALLVGLVFVFFRAVDMDEGFYLSAASLVAEGASPYVDFFFPQTPLLPILFSPFSGLGLSGLIIVRSLALICHLLLAFIAFAFIRRHYSDWRLALAGFFVLALSGPVLAFNVLAVQFVFANLFLMIAYVLLLDSVSRNRINYLVLFGLFFFLGAAVNIRLIILILVPLFCFVAFFVMRTRENFNLLHFSTSVFLGFLAPSLYALELLIQSQKEKQTE